MTYTLNSGKPLEYTGMIKDLPKGKNELTITAIDKLGNSSEKTITFIIE
jgi:hypothetical protein